MEIEKAQRIAKVTSRELKQNPVDFSGLSSHVSMGFKLAAGRGREGFSAYCYSPESLTAKGRAFLFHYLVAGLVEPTEWGWFVFTRKAMERMA